MGDVDIIICRKGKDIQCKLNTGLPVPLPVLVFTWRASDETEAAALERCIREDLDKLLARIRKASYLRGWHDKAGHKRKQKDRFWVCARLTDDEKQTLRSGG